MSAKLVIGVLIFLLCILMIILSELYGEYKQLKVKYNDLKESEKCYRSEVSRLDADLTKIHCEKRELNKLIDDLKTSFDSQDIKLKILESNGTMQTGLWYKPRFYKFKDISEIHEGKIYYPSKEIFYQKNNGAIVINDSWDDMYFPVKDL